MGFVPKDAEYLAEIVQELTVADDPRNIVWRKLTLQKGPMLLREKSSGSWKRNSESSVPCNC